MSRRPRKASRPFCSQQTMEAYKAMKRRELQRQGKPIPSCLLPNIITTPAQHGQQRLLPFTEASR